MTAYEINRKTLIAKINWEKTTRKAGTDDLKDMMDALQEMNRLKVEVKGDFNNPETPEVK